MKCLPAIVILLVAAVAAQGAGTEALQQNVTVLDKAPATSAAILKRNNVEIVAGTGEGKATLTISDDFESGPTTWNLSFATPVNKDGSPSEFANLDGLSNAVRTTFQLSWFLGEPDSFEPLSEFSKVTNALCIEAAKLRGLKNPKSYVDDKCGDATDSGDSFFALAENETGTRPTKKETQRALRLLERRYDCISWAGVDKANCNKIFTIISASGTVGTESFDFFDTDVMEKATTRETVWSAELSAAFLHIPSAWLYRLAYRREEAFKAADSQIFCNMANSGDQLTCQQLPGAPPADNDKDVITLEARRSWKRAGIAPKVSFDLETDVTGIEVPVFLAPNEDGQLTGGLVFGWRDDNDELTLGLFVGVPFKMY